MARNKYPEVTVDKILEVSKKLFLEKGYDKTTIQDIVDELGGLTKGAIYHHFRSKEEIMDALSDKMFMENNPFTEMKKRKDLNGFQKLQAIIKLSYTNQDQSEISKQSIPILKNPRILVQMLETNCTLVFPLLTELVEEGKADGSIKAKYAKELIEVVQLLSNLWLIPSVFPGTTEELQNRFGFLKSMLDCMELPLIDDEIMEHGKKFLEGLGTNE